jgi:hypothetical protein
MPRYHIVNAETLIVEEADRREDGTASELKAMYPDKILVPSEMGKPNKPVIMPGFLFYANTFWAPQRATRQLSAGPIEISTGDFLNLFTMKEVKDLATSPTLRAFVLLLQTTATIRVPGQISRGLIKNMIEEGTLSAAREAEILSLTYQRGQ